MKNYMLAGFTAAIILGGLARVDAGLIVMDFGNAAGISPNSYTEDGFRAIAIDSGTGLNHFDVFNPPSAFTVVGEREMAIHSGNNAEEVLFDFFGQSFDLVSLDVEQFNGTFANTWEIVSSTGTTRTLDTVSTEVFGVGFQNITSFTIQAKTIPLTVGGQIVVDNITFDNAPTTNVVPEPSSITLLTIGAIGLIGYGWRRKRKQAV